MSDPTVSALLQPVVKSATTEDSARYLTCLLKCLGDHTSFFLIIVTHCSCLLMCYRTGANAWRKSMLFLGINPVIWIRSFLLWPMPTFSTR